MKKHSKELVQSILHDKEGDEPQIEEKKTSEAPGKATHVGVECDGCGVAPIVGVRYKCSVKKDFDYCEKCEAEKPHEHAFIKIVNPKQAPKAIFTVVNEEIEGQEQPEGHGKPWKRGGCRGMRGMFRAMMAGRGGCGPNQEGSGSPKRGPGGFMRGCGPRGGMGHGPRHGGPNQDGSGSPKRGPGGFMRGCGPRGGGFGCGPRGGRGGFGHGPGPREGSPFQFD